MIVAACDSRKNTVAPGVTGWRWCDRERANHQLSEQPAVLTMEVPVAFKGADGTQEAVPPAHFQPAANLRMHQHDEPENSGA